MKNRPFDAERGCAQFELWMYWHWNWKSRNNLHRQVAQQFSDKGTQKANFLDLVPDLQWMTV